MSATSKLLFFGALLCACVSNHKHEAVSLPFGKLSTGEEVTMYRLTGETGASVEILDYGCRVYRMEMPDRNGKKDDVVVGYADLSDIEGGKERFFGALLGRYANRIGNASFCLDGEEILLDSNEDFNGVPGHLHGGSKGFDRKMWRGVTFTDKDRVGVRFERLSPDGEEGYPGNLKCSVTYSLDKKNVLRIEYGAETDKPTIVCLSNHTYYNLKGSAGGTVMDNMLKVNAETYLTNNERFVAKRAPDSVTGTPFDMREQHRIDYALDIPNEQIETMGGFSVCWVLRKAGAKLKEAADLYEPVSGRGVRVLTTEPGLLIYTGKSLGPEIIGKYGPLTKNGGAVIETIHFPDTPNHPEFPSAVLRPGEKYHSITEYHFYTK